MSSFVIDTSSVQLGQVIRNNITDQGIFRTFYNDINGNMYSALSRESNYKQVVYNSAYKRTVMDNSGMNAPFYGGTYHPNELTYVDNSRNFYIFKYPTDPSGLNAVNRCVTDRGPISYFTEVQLQSYISQGDSSGNLPLYNTNGSNTSTLYQNGVYSKGAILRYNGGSDSAEFNWFEQVGFGYCTTETGGYGLDPSSAAAIATELGLPLGGGGADFISTGSTKGLYAYYNDTTWGNSAFFGTGGSNSGGDSMKSNKNITGTRYRPGIPATTTMGLFVPDLINLSYDSLTSDQNGVINKPLNDLVTTFDFNNPSRRYRFITEPWETDISNNSASGPSSLHVKYYIASKRPKYVWMDTNIRPISPFTQNWSMEDTDSYYKGRWSIYVDVKNKVRSTTPPYSLEANDMSGNIYISRSNRAHKPVYTHQLIAHYDNNQIGSNNEINNVFVDLDLDISKNAYNKNYNNIYARPYYVVTSDASSNLTYGYAPYDLNIDNSDNIVKNDIIGLNLNYINRHCKIKVDYTSIDYTTTRWHIVYFHQTSTGALAYLGYATGISGEDWDPVNNSEQKHYSINNTNKVIVSKDGGFPSMDIDKNGHVHIAYLTRRQQGFQDPWCIMYLKAKNSFPQDDSTTHWEYTDIEDLNPAFDQPGGTYYTDLSNNQPINLKISPYDQSTHITYQYKNADGTYSIKYWTNSDNTKDINKITGQLNYVGLHTKGATIDDISGSAEVYWDLSQVNCIFSRDYTRYDDNGDKIGLTTPEFTVKQFLTPYGARPGLGVGQTDTSCTTNPDNPTQGWMSGIIFNKTFLDKVYIITTIKTPPSPWPGSGPDASFYYLFYLGGKPYGGYTAWVAPGNFVGGYVGFGPLNSISASSVVTRWGAGTVQGGIPYKNGAPYVSGTQGVDTLLADTNYQLEFYYNRGNSYAFIKIKNLDGVQADGSISNTYEYYDISSNGGWNVRDGNLTIGNPGHTSGSNPLRGTIYKMSIYATDISNVPTFDLSRNGEIISDASGSFSSFYDNSGNTGLLIEPEINKFQVVNAVNSLNDGSIDISGSSYIKNGLLHDVYYYQRIDDQNVPVINQYSKQFVNAFDKFTIKNSQGYYEMWAAGHSANGTGNESITPLLWKSYDGGLTWIPVTTYNNNANLAVISEEILSIKCFVDSNIQPDGYGGKWVFLVGEEFMIHVSNDYNSSGIVDRSQLGTNWQIIGSAPDPSGNGNPHGFYFQNTGQALYSVCPTRINEAESTAIFGGAPAGGYNHHFHLWIGGTYMWYYGGAPPGDLLIRINYTDCSNNTCDYSNNLISYQIRDSSDNPTSTDTSERGPRTYSFGGDYSGNGYNTAGYSYGIVGTDNYIYQTNDGGNNWNKRLGVDGVWLADCGGGYPGSFERGVQGSYVEKNPNPSGVYDNSGMYVQTSTEAWNGLPGFTVAYNDSSFNLAFNPQDNTNAPKDTTWDPSLNANSFWNVQIPDNSGQPVLWKYGGSNSIKTYIDNKSSAGGVFKNKQLMWAVDDFIAGDSTTSYWGTDHTETPNLYLRDSELENQWQRIVPSVVDPSLNTYPEKQSLSWAGFSDYDCSYSIVNLAFANDVNKTIFNTVGDTNQYVGFYKLGKVPPKIFLKSTSGGSTDPYTITLNIQYKINDSVQYFLSANSLLNFSKLNITAHFEEAVKSGSGSYGSWTVVSSGFGIYSTTLSNRTPGKTFKYRSRLSNDYGYGWYSNETEEITTPAPSPTIDNLTAQTKLFETIVRWKPQEVGNVQSVYSYNIQKQYFDVSLNQYIEEPNFTQFYQDLSGQLNDPARWKSINGELWTGPYDPNSPTPLDPGLATPTDLSFVDVDLSLNTVYRYNITAFPLIIGTVAPQTYTVYTYVSSALPQYQTYEYSSNDASFNILWSISTDISSNCELTWDISWQEIRQDGTTANKGIIEILDTDAAINGQDIGKKRCINLPLLNNHLQADASYNFQIKSDLSNNSQPIGDYTPASAKYQQYLYSGGSEYDPSFVNVYYNYQEPPTLNNASYVDNTVNVNWSATTIPTNPVAYDVSFSNTTINREDVSYNFIVYNGTSLVDPSNNGKNYYPGDYNVRVKAYYGNQVPVDISLVSQWSNELPLSGGVPEHLPNILTATPYNNNDQPGNNTDVSYVKLSWNSVSNDDFALTGFPIPENYTLVRKTASKDYNYIVDYATDIPRTNTSFNDNNHPLGHTNPQGGPTIPRIYYYDLSANYL